jgi:MYXO-CTERM domain-containing protein
VSDSGAGGSESGGGSGSSGCAVNAREPGPFGVGLAMLGVVAVLVALRRRGPPG